MRNFFASFQPEPNELLRRVSQHIDTPLLHEIAAADYRRDIEEHMTHLRQIRYEGLFKTPMNWHPQEVLELIRWSEPDDPSWKPGREGEPGHWMRAFACAALLRAAGEKGNEDLRSGWNQTLIQLIDSLQVVGQNFYEEAAAFLAWLILRFEPFKETEELGFLMLGLLWFALHLQVTIGDDVLVCLCERIVAEEKRRSTELCAPNPDRWLLGTTVYNLRHANWERLGLSLAGMDFRGRSPELRNWIGLIASELVGT